MIYIVEQKHPSEPALTSMLVDLYQRATNVGEPWDDSRRRQFDVRNLVSRLLHLKTAGVRDAGAPQNSG